ncbi:MAG: hypothetical protein WCD18_06630 [Thermosynechococcaceae cyanobacterium]
MAISRMTAVGDSDWMLGVESMGQLEELTVEPIVAVAVISM